MTYQISCDKINSEKSVEEITILINAAIALASGIILADKIDFFTAFVIYISSLLSLVSAGIIFKSKTGILKFLLTIVFIGIAISQYAQSYEMNGLFPVDDKFVEISGYVSEIPSEKDGRYTYIITCDGAKYKDKIYNAKENVLLNTDKKLFFGQNVGVRGFLTRFDGKMNYNSFDYEKYYKSRRVFYSISDYEIATDNTFRQLYSPKDLGNNYKSSIHKLIDEYISGDEAGILKAVMTGYKMDFSDDFYTILQKTGTIRFLYPGYLHILLIFTLLELLFPFAGTKFRENIAIILIVTYALFNSDSGAILKIALVNIIAIIFLRKYGYLHFPDILSASVIGILIGNPLMIYNSGFIMSVTISWLFFMLRKPAYNLFGFLKNKWLIRYLSLWLLSAVGTAPLLAYFYDGIAPFTTLFTVVYLPVTAVILVLFPLMWMEISILGHSYIFAKGILSSVLLLKKLPYFIDSLPFSSIRLARPSLIVIVMFYIAVILIRDIYYKKAGRTRVLFFGAMLTGGIISMIIINLMTLGSVGITFVNVGQGDGIAIELPKGERILVDGGGGEEFSDYDAGEDIFLPYLLDEGMFRIDMAIVSHYHKDHCLGTISAMKELNIHTVAMPDMMKGNKYRQEIEDLASQKGIDILYLKRGDRITFESGAVLNVISPSSSDNRDENDTSIVFTLDANNFKALFTGDTTQNIEKKYLNDFTDVDLLKVAHHGSDTSSSTEFIQKISPEYAVISVGKDNMYNHPNDTVIAKLKKSGAHILRTDLHGDIRFTIFKNGNIRYSTFYNE